jgi:hypothetical protein
MRQGDACDCDEGWTGINCNVCTEDKVCNALMETGDGGVCYQNGEVVQQNYQMCDVTNEKILGMLEGKIPQATFTCIQESGVCDFQCKWDTLTFYPRYSLAADYPFLYL